MLGSTVVGVSSTVFLAGCTTGQLTEAVNAVVVAANLTLGILESTGTVPPSVVMLVAPYLASVGQAVIDTNAEAQSTDTAAVKATKIAAIWANLVAGVALPSNAPPILATVIAEVVAAIKSLLAIVGNGTMQLVKLAQANNQFTMTRGDRRKLGQLTSEASDIKKRAMALK